MGCRGYKKLDETLGSFSISGLQNGGKITVVSINNTTWLPLPTIPLTARNSMRIQNVSGQEIKLQYDNTTIGYVGIRIPNDGENFYNITDDIILYAKSAISACTIVIEEIS